ncbi:hypothetical protein [Flavobacterium sp. DSR2-3-3]
MSFDSLSKNAIVKLNQGAQKEKLHHNTINTWRRILANGYWLFWLPR